jgi:hypothetical protein
MRLIEWIVTMSVYDMIHYCYAKDKHSLLYCGRMLHVRKHEEEMWIIKSFLCDIYYYRRSTECVRSEKRKRRKRC